MFKYFASRFLFFSIAGIFLGWSGGISSSDQLYNFFGIEFWAIFKILIALIVLFFGVLVLILTMSLLYWREYFHDELSYYFNVDEKFASVLKLIIFERPFKIILYAYKYEIQREKNVGFLFIWTFIFIYPFFGTPFVSNYSAIYGTMQGQDVHDVPVTIEIPGYVVSNSERDEEEDKMINEKMDIDDVDKKSFVFLDAALIEGYKSKNFKTGFKSYFRCLPYYFLEILIRTLLLFLLPYVLFLLVLKIVNNKNGVNKKEFGRTPKNQISTALKKKETGIPTK